MEKHNPNLIIMSNIHLEKIRHAANRQISPITNHNSYLNLFKHPSI